MIALYLRVSTTEQAEHGYSIDEQEDRLRSYCKALNWTNLKVYRDAGFSGAKLDRPALQSLIADVKSHKVNKVLVYKLDRLSRSQKDTLMLIEDIFLSNDCDFVSITENFDTSTPLGRAMIGILSVFAQLEREQIKERMSMGREARAKQGKYAGSWRLPLGYDYENGQLIPNEFEKEQIRIIFEDYSAGKSLRSIATSLNEKGMIHRYGEWKPEVIRSILVRKTYIGYVKFSNEWYKGTHEPIISEELFDKVQKEIAKRDSESKCNRGNPLSYFGGMIYCKRCGRVYTMFTRRTVKRGKEYSYEYYCCNGRCTRRKGPVDCDNDNWKVQEFDEIIFNEIRKLKFTPAKRSKTPNKTHLLDKRINELNKQLERLMDLYTVGELPLDIIQKKTKEISEQKAKLEKELQIDTRTSISEAKEIVASFDDILDRPLEDVRAALRTLIDRIEVDGENIYIYWAFE
jgi:site-specific DNA recombinase